MTLAPASTALSASEWRTLASRILSGDALHASEYLFLLTSISVGWENLAKIARELRQRSTDNVITYSPKVFLPLTNLCRDRCGYCTFRRDPGQPGAHWMAPEEVLDVARKGERLGCREALLSLGDRPEAEFPEAREWLAAHGHARTLDYVAEISELLLAETTLLPHSNPGLMSRSDLERLRESNASLGLMLESTSPALFAPGGAHDDAIDKRPERRLQTIRQAGELKIPFTTGILVGIGESPADIVDSLLTLRDIHAQYGHIQEVIIQNFVPKREVPMRDVPTPAPEYFARIVALARIIFSSGFGSGLSSGFGPRMNIQAPPNLSPAHLEMLLDSGLNDWGGISPLTVDFINPEKPWPQVESLRALAASKGLELRERLPVYPEYATRPEFFSPRVWQAMQSR
ncbi:MAG: 7,8-didemethyl-8-hydroxy-5-deazariboflavin synthase subunit CofG [Acidobacteria bacterium]|nr:7,8-didemethyl-8-hydroxy-5-deazariboflavin synthase subunit CofG [Acidobacteriota bacterium]